MTQLDEFFQAYDRVHVLGAEAPDWPKLQKELRRSILAPKLRFLGSIGLLLLFLAFGVLSGHPTGYMLALGTLMAVIPGRYAAIGKRAEELANLGDVEDLRAHVLRQAQLRRADAFLGCLFHLGLGLLFMAVGGVAAILGKDFRPGLFAGGVLWLWALYDALFRFRRAARECAAWGEEDDDEAAEDEGGGDPDRSAEADGRRESDGEVRGGE